MGIRFACRGSCTRVRGRLPLAAICFGLRRALRLGLRIADSFGQHLAQLSLGLRWFPREGFLPLYHKNHVSGPARHNAALNEKPNSPIRCSRLLQRNRRANSIAYGGDEELDKPREDRSTLPIENQSFVSSGEGVFIPAFSFPGFELNTRSVTGQTPTQIPNRSAWASCKAARKAGSLILARTGLRTSSCGPKYHSSHANGIEISPNQNKT